MGKVFSETHENKQLPTKLVEDLSFGKLIFWEVGMETLLD